MGTFFAPPGIVTLRIVIVGIGIRTIKERYTGARNDEELKI